MVHTPKLQSVCRWPSGSLWLAESLLPCHHSSGPCSDSCQRWPSPSLAHVPLTTDAMATPRDTGLLTRKDAGIVRAWSQFGCDSNLAGLSQGSN